MNVTLNNRIQTNQYYNQQSVNNCKPKPSFKGGEGALSKVVNSESSFYKSMEKVYNDFSEVLAKNVVPHIMDNKLMGWIAEKSKNTGLLFNHFQAVGSLITSGLYMQKTLSNKDLDKDRKQTLAINQGLTFGISTVGAYALDKYLNNWWQGVTAKYAGLQLDDATLATRFKSANKEIKAENKLIKAANKVAGAVKKELKKTKSVGDFIDKSGKHTEETLNSLNIRLKGMDVLKKMLVFGMVYRYLVPVLVVPIANKIGEKRIAAKKAKEAQAAPAANVAPAVKDAKTVKVA